MSTISIEKPQRRGTPFDQATRARRTPRPVPPGAPTPPAPRPIPRPRVKAVAPDRSYEQRMQALEIANSVRSDRAQLKRDIKAGRKRLIDILLDPPAYTETMKAFDLMLATPKYGRVKVNKILSTCRISPSKTIGGMSERQRRELAERIIGL